MQNNTLDQSDTSSVPCGHSVPAFFTILPLCGFWGIPHHLTLTGK